MFDLFKKQSSHEEDNFTLLTQNVPQFRNVSLQSLAVCEDSFLKFKDRVEDEVINPCIVSEDEAASEDDVASEDQSKPFEYV